MENETENFDQLKKLLALKKHELPPPGYFNKFSGHVLSRIRAERAGQADSFHVLEKEAPWVMRLWQALEAKPLFAGAFGAVVCSVVLFGIVMNERPPERTGFAGAPIPFAEPVNNGPVMAGVGDPEKPVMLATNGGGVNLFEMIPNGQTAPVGFTSP